MDECYFEIEEAEPMDEMEQARVLRAALSRNAKGKKHMSKSKLIAVVAAAAVGVTALTAGAVNLFHIDERLSALLNPVNEQQTKDLENASVALDQTATDAGWTMAMQGAFGDSHTAYIIFDMIAPEGTVLDGEAYRFESPIVWADGSAGYSCDTLEDDDKTDNRVTFALQLNTEKNLSGSTISLDMRNLQEVSNEPRTVAEGEWKTELKLDYQDNSVELPAGKDITVLGEAVKVDRLRVSPIAVSVEMKGELFARLDKEPTGETPAAAMILHFKDGSTLRYDPAGEAQDDFREAGTSGTGNQLIQTVSFRSLIDLDALQSVEIEGVSFPVK